MPIPDYQSLMLPVLQTAQDGEVRISSVVASLADKLRMNAEELATLLPSGKQTLFTNRVHWAKTYLGKAGLIESTRRGHFKITPRGQHVLDGKPTKIDNAFLTQFQEFRAFSDRSVLVILSDNTLPDSSFVGQSATPDEVMRGAHRQIEAALAQDLLDRVRSAPPEFFEQLIVNLLIAMGYGGSAADAGRAIGRSGDDGVDGVIDQDALGLDRVYVQAKWYAAGNTVGSGAIRDFFGSLDRHKAAKGLFVTTSAFSTAARETAEFLSKRIVLLDAPQLTRLMIRHNIGCRIEETLHVKKLDEDFFE